LPSSLGDIWKRKKSFAKKEKKKFSMTQIPKKMSVAFYKNVETEKKIERFCVWAFPFITKGNFILSVVFGVKIMTK
jgi:hypothetical protein